MLTPLSVDDPLRSGWELGFLVAKVVARSPAGAYLLRFRMAIGLGKQSAQAGSVDCQRSPPLRNSKYHKDQSFGLTAVACSGLHRAHRDGCSLLYAAVTSSVAGMQQGRSGLFVGGGRGSYEPREGKRSVGHAAPSPATE